MKGRAGLNKALALTCPFQPKAPGLNLTHKAVVGDDEDVGVFVVKSGVYEVKETSRDEKLNMK